MTKYALLKYTNVNLGDQIQSIAAKRFLPGVDYLLDRDHLNDETVNERVKIILNGWFTNNPDGWPPNNDNIEPLIISLHISDKHGSSEEKLIDPESVEYFKKHEPIGCRDFHTMNLLKDKGVDAYFSGCLTLTLENKFNKRTDDIYIVDVDKRIRKLIPWRLRKKTEFITHIDKDPDNNHKFNKTQVLLDKYAQAKLVITSRLHCALPCLAFGTPVIFIPKETDDKRFGGLIDLLRQHALDDLLIKKVNINWNEPEKNPVDFTSIKNGLIKTCNEFIAKEIINH